MKRSDVWEHCFNTVVVNLFLELTDNKVGKLKSVFQTALSIDNSIDMSHVCHPTYRYPESLSIAALVDLLKNILYIRI